MKRNKQIKFRLSEEEYSTLVTRIKKSGLSMQEFFVRLVNGIEIKELPAPEFIEILKQLRYIGNNLDQIAVKAHTLNFIDAPAYRENIALLERVTGEIIEAIY